MDDYNIYQNQSEPSPTPPPGTPLTPDAAPKTSSALSTVSLVMGICSLVLLCCGCGPLFGALGIIFALLSRTSHAMNKTAKVGFGLSIGGAVLSIIVYLVYFIAIFQSADFNTLMQEYEDYYNYGTNDYDDSFYNDDAINDLLDRYSNYNNNSNNPDKTL